MVSIELNDEEKFEVLLVAFALFLVASCISICIAATCCPINKWLHERYANKRRQQQQQRDGGSGSIFAGSGGAFAANLTMHQQHPPTLIVTSGAKSSSRHSLGCTYSGPPPTYEVALSAARVQSVMSSPIVHSSSGNLGLDNNDWSEKKPQDATSNNPEKELDLGDYFHPPKEMLYTGGPFGELSLEQVFVPPGAINQATIDGSPGDQHQQHQPPPLSQESLRAVAANCLSPPPIMLRLWARLIEPGDLVDRARCLARENKLGRRAGDEMHSSSVGTLAGVATTIGDHWEQAEAGIRRLSTQLSLPQIFGSLIAIGTPKTATINDSSTCIEVDEEERDKTEENDDDDDAEMTQHQQMNSLDSSTTTSGEFDQVCEVAESDLARSINNRRSTRSDCSSKSASSLMSQAISTPTGKRLLSQIESVTSRVLHMNVASFSYVKDEKLVNTKKHCQMNFKHFFEDEDKLQQVQQDENKIQAKNEPDSKLCQLMISICDIENLLNSCWLGEKACVLLSQYSSVYVRCDIIGSRSKYPVRLLRNPLRALQQAAKNDFRRDSEDINKHTVDFGAVISASAMEQPAPIPIVDGSSIMGKQLLVNSSCRDTATSTSTSPDNSLTGKTSNDSSSDQKSGSKTVSINDAQSAPSNWRHDPSADGKAIVTFNSVPKLIADMHQFAAAARVRSQQVAASDARGQQESGTIGHQSTDLIQFDSVFISPMLSKTLIESSYLRLRIYSQSKYINDTCLAELKLPLRQLTLSPTKDNLYEVPVSQATASSEQGESMQTSEEGTSSEPQVDTKKSGLILDNLVANLVTADTGSPLANLVEKVSEEKAFAAERDARLETMAKSSGDVVQQSSEGMAASIKDALFGFSGTFGTGPAKSCSAGLSSLSEDTDQRHLARNGHSLGTALDRLSSAADIDRAMRDELMYCSKEDENQIERLSQNRVRSLMVSHWLDYLSAPAYECESVEEVRGELVMGLTYLPTSNRLIMHAHRANLDSCEAGKRLAKKLRMAANATYQLRLLMVANGRVLKRKQTTPVRRLEWDSQEPITFDLAHSNVEQPAFIVALVVRNGPDQQVTSSNTITGLGCGLPQCNCAKMRTTKNSAQQQQHQPTTGAMYSGETRFEPEVSRRFTPGNARNDLVAGHVVLGEDIWKELRSQPRKQIVKQFKML